MKMASSIFLSFSVIPSANCQPKRQAEEALEGAAGREVFHSLIPSEYGSVNQKREPSPNVEVTPM